MINQSLSRLIRYIQIVPLRFNQLPEDLQRQRPAPGKWSKQEILGHLVDSALHNWQRMAIAKESDGPYIASPYLQEELVRNNAYQTLPAAQISQLWQNLNQQIIEVCQRLSEQDLKKEIHFPYADNSGKDLAFLINSYVDHLEHHLQQIFGSLENLERVEGWQISRLEGKEALDKQEPKRFITLKERESLLVEYYAPVGTDPQQPHEQDEIYVVTSGTGIFYCDGQRKSFQSGDLLFVPAGIEHRFEDFSTDFETWVIFFGPKGGELPVDRPLVSERTIDGRDFQISTRKNLLDIESIYAFLQTSYWANRRTKENIQKSLDHCLSFGLYQNGQQIGLARVVTDYGVFAYLADVYVLDEFRGLGLGQWLTQTVMAHPDLQTVKWYLVTKDAHRLYEKLGFATTEYPDRIMIRERL